MANTEKAETPTVKKQTPPPIAPKTGPPSLDVGLETREVHTVKRRSVDSAASAVVELDLGARRLNRRPPRRQDVSRRNPEPIANGLAQACTQHASDQDFRP
jgi:hypothetical protein